MVKHPFAVIESDSVGEGTKIWAFAHILRGARIGSDCSIFDHTFIDNDVVIGDRVIIKSGVHLSDGITIEDDVFVGPNATFGNDAAGRDTSGQFSSRTYIRRGASIGASATVLPGITVGERAIIREGTVVTLDVPDQSIVAGNPGRITGYVNEPASIPEPSAIREGPSATSVRGVRMHKLPMVDDLRGLLSFAEAGHEIPFEVKRYFLVFDVASKHIRGEHAHRRLHQFLVCVHGSCSVIADDGIHREEFLLDHPTIGLHLPPMVWGVQYKYTPDGVLLVLASDYYDPNDYIRSYDEFRELVKPQQ